MVVAMSLMGLFSGKRLSTLSRIAISPESFRLKLSDAVYALGKAQGSLGSGKIYLRANRQQTVIQPKKTWRTNIEITIAGMDLLSGEIELSENAVKRIRAGGREIFYIITKVDQIKGVPDQALAEFISDVAVTLNRQHSNYALMAMGNKRRHGVTPDDKENVARAMNVLLAEAKENIKGGG